MASNSFGSLFRMTSFGESHGLAMGVVVDGCPAGVQFDMDLLLRDLARRRPGQGSIVTSRRQELDQPQILSGIFNGKTLGTPIAVVVYNQDARSEDYKKIQKRPRQGHADDVWKTKFGIADHRGGGRSSGRETVARVIAGSFAKMFIQQTHPRLKIQVSASQMGPHRLSPNRPIPEKVMRELKRAQQDGESWGGQVQIVVKHPPSGLGQPIFHKLKADLASACLSIGATTSFELGDGHTAATAVGTEFHRRKKTPYGGIRGGISTGEEIQMSLIFKPTSSILDVAKKGRHDPCIVIRAIPVVESMVALVLADHLLWARMDRVQL